MDDWLSFIIFAGLFYVMMRYGCGAHMIHGHRDDAKHIDPVCGMEVEADKGYGKMHEGTLYRFCSRNCLDNFENDPDRYLTTSDKTGGER
jgi:YHS domain-containing protein